MLARRASAPTWRGCRAMLSTARPRCRCWWRADGRSRARRGWPNWLALRARAIEASPISPPQLDPRRCGGPVRRRRRGAESGGTFARALRSTGGRAVLMVRGRPAADSGARAARSLLWVIDATRQRGRRSAAAMSRASGSPMRSRRCPALIEAAPFPMWHRGPDLRLTLVNRAYVARGRGEDAGDAVARGLELIERAAAPAARSPPPRPRASEARSSTRIVPAIIGGERRAMRVVDVPLGEAGVAGYAIDVEELEQAHAPISTASPRRSATCSTGCRPASPSSRRSAVWSSPTGLRRGCSRCSPNGSPTGPNSIACSSGCARPSALPESRDFPGWKAEQRRWFIDAEPRDRGKLAAAGRHASARRRPAFARWRPAADLRGSHRAGRSSPARATRCCASAPRPSTICSRRSACSPPMAGCTCGTAASARCGSWTRRSWRSIRGSMRWSPRSRAARLADRAPG